MTKRLVEEYRPGDRVEVRLTGVQGAEWHAARVVALQHPGVWVQTEDRAAWFVTNTRHIRAAPSEPAS